jgi:hypothetical protein
MHLIFARLARTSRKGSSSVEFALISTLFLLPLFGGTIDFIQYIAAKDQLNTALQSLYYYSLTYVPGTYTAGTAPTMLTDPAAFITADNTKKVLALMSSKVTPITLVSGYPSISYKCLDALGAVMSPAPTTNNSCTTAYPYEQIWVSFQIQSEVNFVVPVLFAANASSVTLTASGSVEIF